MATKPMTLLQCELLAIRYLAQIAESISHGLTTLSSVQHGRERLAQEAITGMCDRIEHIAQYVLEGLSESTRATYLTKDIESMKVVLTEFARDMPAVGAVPTVNDLTLLLLDLQGFSDRPTN